MIQPPRRMPKGAYSVMLVALMASLLAACAPVAAPTATPTKAPAGATASAPATSGPTAPAKATAQSSTSAATPGAAAGTKPSGTPIKIGYLTPLTGPSAPFGALETISINLGETDINTSGAINGYPLQIVRYDSPFDPQQAVTLVRKLAGDDKVLAILGPYSSGEMDVAAPLANQLQIPVIGMKTTKPGFSENHRPWEFRFTSTDDITTPAIIAGFKKLHPDVKSVLIVGDTKESVTSSMVNDIWPKYLKDAGLAVQGTVGYDSGTTDFSAIVTKIKGMNPQAIAYSATPKGNPVGFAKELATQQVKVPVMSSVHFVPGPFVVQGGAAMEGWLAAAWFDRTSTDPKAQDFLKRWQAQADVDPKVSKPALLTLEANTYDVMLILGDIMRKANITPETPLQEARTKIRDGLAAVKDYKGVSGNITMQPNGDASIPATVLIARNGAWQVVK